MSLDPTFSQNTESHEKRNTNDDNIRKNEHPHDDAISERRIVNVFILIFSFLSSMVASSTASSMIDADPNTAGRKKVMKKPKQHGMTRHIESTNKASQNAAIQGYFFIFFLEDDGITKKPSSN